MLRLKARIRKWKAERKLKKSGYESWSQYKRNRDDAVNAYANDVDEFYTGYPYVYACLDYNHYAYSTLWDYGPGGRRHGWHDMIDWCEEKIRWNYRCDVHCVWKNVWGKMELNDIGGHDIIYFAFKHERDYVLFMLRWS
jgi:hypothetical protein